MEFLFMSRGAGKRQVKPSQDIALLEEAIAGQESSDDSEYLVDEDKEKNKDHSGDSGDSSSDSSNSSDGSSEDEGGAQDELKALKDEGFNTAELMGLSAAALRSAKPFNDNVKVCGACLGKASNDANEIVECDGCGISVHEGCYGISDSTSIASTISDASTEPWFCEPCRAGLRDSPNCELCPNKGGVYKQTDVGRWVHLVCALYVPGVAFGELDKLTHVTIFEMNYSNYGRWPCILCEDERIARTGVAIQCDAGMCKNHFHACCAQAHGLLTEPIYSEPDAYIAHCKIHTDKTVIKNRKQSFLTFVLGTKHRRNAIKEREENTNLPGGVTRYEDESADQRILRKLLRHQNKFVRDKVKKPDPWIPTNKINRAFTTCSSGIRKIQRMGEINGDSLERQKILEQQITSVMEVKKKWHVPPAFNAEFVSYFHDRKSRIGDLQKSLSDEVKSHSNLRDQESVIRPKFDLTTRNQESSLDTNKDLRDRITRFRGAMVSVCPARTLPFEPAMTPLLRNLDIVTPNLKPKATVWASSGGGKSKGKSHMLASSGLSSPVKLKTCQLCKRTKDQHRLAHCDTCKLDYHLGCLTPPLTRMPKKSKLYGWQCSECDRESSSDTMDKQELEAPRKKRQAATKARINSLHSANNSDIEEFLQSSSFMIPSNNKTVRDQPNGHHVPNDVPSTSSPTFPAQNNGVKQDEANKADESFEVDVTSNNDAESEAQRLSLIQQAASEEHRRKKEKKKKKKRKRERQERERQERQDAFDDDDIEIIEDENGCTVRIRPKAIKLKIKTPLNPGNSYLGGAGTSSQTVTPKTNGHGNGNNSNNISNSGNSATNQTDVNPYEFVDDDMDDANDEADAAPASPVKKKRRSSKGKDIRSHCDKCDTEGNNDNLVRCDDCRKCFHFGCLIPPVKKSPKVAGYSWNCDDCAPSEVDSDWHLDA